jgi:hypothetical protein
MSSTSTTSINVPQILPGTDLHRNLEFKNRLRTINVEAQPTQQTLEKRKPRQSEVSGFFHF